ncbi:hypothetical protein GALL_481220 [mine drainage metagenome]|uniref:Uncharacterized protein n=1 Tax=mine drainage metagenome TaxID=410659 RepID=A0A1J5PYC5_9ZZZZ
MLPGVEDAGRQGDQRDEAGVGEHQARHPYRGVECRRVKARCGEEYQRRRDQHAAQAHRSQDPGQRRGDVIDQFAVCRFGVLGPRLGEDGDEGLRECALGEQAAQQIGQAERDVEGIRPGAGAEIPCHQNLAQQAGDAGDEGEQGNGIGGLEQIHRGDYRQVGTGSLRMGRGQV